MHAHMGTHTYMHNLKRQKTKRIRGEKQGNEKKVKKGETRKRINISKRKKEK